MNKLRFPGLLFFAIACAQSLVAAQPGAWHTYHNEEFGYELQYPAGWNVLLPDVFQKVTFQELESRVWPGEFLVQVREHVEGLTLDEWADTNFTDVHDESLVSSVEDTMLAGRAARLFTVFGFDHTRIVVAFVHDRKIYEISYTGSTPNDPDLSEHGSIYEHMRQSFQLVPSIEAEVFDLGGPCDEGEGSTPADFHTRLREASQQGNHRQMIDLQKQYVRAMCSNHYRWFGLAKTYLGADRPGMAIQVLHELHRRGAEIKPSTFQHQANLAKLIDMPEFQNSELGRELRELRTAADQRKDVYLTQLRALDVSGRPPERYVARGACPFECCSYREWDVLKTTALYDVPFGTLVVSSAVKGQRVRGVTGDVHLRPTPVAVVHDRSSPKKSSRSMTSVCGRAATVGPSTSRVRKIVKNPSGGSS
jgi:hypothetical protein